MMVNKFDQPKNGRFFRVLGLCRASSTQQQAGSLADQERLLQQHLKNLLEEKRYELYLQNRAGRQATSWWLDSLLKTLNKLTAKMRHI